MPYAILVNTKTSTNGTIMAHCYTNLQWNENVDCLLALSQLYNSYAFGANLLHCRALWLNYPNVMVHLSSLQALCE